MKKKKNYLLNGKSDRKTLLQMMAGAKARNYRRMLTLNMLNLGMNQKTIAEIVQCSPRTVRNIKKNYLENGLCPAINDSSRSGQPRKIDNATEELIVANVCANPPKGQARWTLQLIKQVLTDKRITDISKESIRIILGNRDIKPWIHKMWCIPDVTEEFILKMEDVLRLYEKPYNKNEPVLCLDEKLVMLLDSKKEPYSKNGATKQDYEYKRCGTANAFCVIEPKNGKHITIITHKRTKLDFADLIKLILKKYRSAHKIHIVMDNLNTHNKSSLIEKFGEKKGTQMWSRIVPHYTPKHASWLNQAEIEIGMFSKTCLGKRRFNSIELLRQETFYWNQNVNKNKIKINWRFSRLKARAKFNYKRGKN
jgi:transposase